MKPGSPILRAFRLSAILCVSALFAVFTACSPSAVDQTPLPSAMQLLTASPSQEPSETNEMGVQVQPELTSTSEPLAASINGEEILLEDYQVELTLYQAAVGTVLATENMEIVIQDLIDQVLLAQAAAASGFVIDEAMIQNRINELGLSDQALSEWKAENGYSEEGFLRAMKRAIASAWMRDQLLAEVPLEAEQVHARQILLYNLEEAEAVYAQLQAGADFGTLAVEYDPVTKGELGWFPRGYLMVNELDDVLFSLEPGAYSPVLETSLGYHIVQVLAHDANHPLGANAHQLVMLQSLAQWLDDRRSQSEIILYLP